MFHSHIALQTKMKLMYTKDLTFTFLYYQYMTVKISDREQDVSLLFAVNPGRPASSASSLLSSRFQKMPNGSLVITDVTTDDTGRYTCVAGNSCSIKDRVAQLYVVGEFKTHTTTQTYLHRLSTSGTKLYTLPRKL